MENTKIEVTFEVTKKTKHSKKIDAEIYAKGAVIGTHTGLFVQNTLLGFALFLIKKNIAELKFISIIDNYRKNGYGSKLLKEIEVFCKKENVNKITLFVLNNIKEDMSVKNFYKKNGYFLEEGKNFIYSKNI